MRNREFFPLRKRDVGLIHEDGFYLDSVPKKIGGPEKVGQMCAIILLKRLNAERVLKEVGNYDLLPFVVSQLVEATISSFENTGEPDENLKDLVVEELVLNNSSKTLYVRLGVYTQAGDYAPLHLRLPIADSKERISVSI